GGPLGGSPQGAARDAAQHDLNQTAPIDEPVQNPPVLAGRIKGSTPKNTLKRKDEEAPERLLTPKERLQVLDMWERSNLPACDFAPLVGVAKHTLHSWRKRFAD